MVEKSSSNRARYKSRHYCSICNPIAAKQHGELTTDILVEDLESVEARDEASRSRDHLVAMAWCVTENLMQ